MAVANSAPAAPRATGAAVSPVPASGGGRPKRPSGADAYSPGDRGMETCCQPFRNPRTSVSLYRRCPPGVRIDDSLPPLAHRVTVFGSTRSIAATSAGVRRRFSGLIWVLTTDGPLALGGSGMMTDSNDSRQLLTASVLSQDVTRARVLLAFCLAQGEISRARQVVHLRRTLRPGLRFTSPCNCTDTMCRDNLAR